MASCSPEFQRHMDQFFQVHSDRIRCSLLDAVSQLEAIIADLPAAPEGEPTDETEER